MNDNQALMTCEVEDIKKTVSSLLWGELKMEKTITCIEPYFKFIFHPKTDKLNYHVEWIVYFWDSGALTNHYFTIVLWKDNIEALRDYFSAIIEKGTRNANKSS